MKRTRSLKKTNKKNVDWLAICAQTQINGSLSIPPPVVVMKTSSNVVSEVEPMLPMLAKAVRGSEAINTLNTNGLTKEIKYDGERILCSVQLHDGKKTVNFYSRTLKPIKIDSINVQLTSDNHMIILDGERVYLDPDTDKPIAICNTGYRKKLKQVFMVFDVQALNNEYVMHLSLEQRRNLLSTSIIENNYLSIVKWQDVLSIDTLFHDFKQAIDDGLEGFVLKYKDSPYFSNTRCDWIKMKPLYMECRLEIDLFAIGAKRDRNNEWAILNCGYFKDNKFIKVCTVSSGIKENDKNRISLFINNESGVFIKPIVTTLAADSITTNNCSLRHPQFLRFCPEKTQVTFPQI